MPGVLGFLTGFDEHSANVERDARAAGIDPHDLIDPWAETWQAAFGRFGISADRFIRTTDPDHASAAAEMVRRAQANGDVYEGVYSGWFCTGCNEFKTDQQLVDGRCPEHPTLDPQWLEENNYFFRLSAYQERLEQLGRKVCGGARAARRDRDLPRLHAGEQGGSAPERNVVAHVEDAMPVAPLRHEGPARQDVLERPAGQRRPADEVRDRARPAFHASDEHGQHSRRDSLSDDEA